MEASSIAYARLGWLTILVHSDAPVTDAEWSAYLDGFVPMVESGDLDRACTLVVSISGQAPTASQRKLASDALQGASVPTAVMTGAWMARAAVTAMSWFNPSIRAFEVDDLPGALAYLQVGDGALADQVASTVAKLRARMEARPLSQTG